MNQTIIISRVEICPTPERQFRATLRTECDTYVSGKSFYGATAEEAEAKLLKRLAELEETYGPYALPGRVPTTAEITTVALVVIAMFIFGLGLNLAEGGK